MNWLRFWKQNRPARVTAMPGAAVDFADAQGQVIMHAVIVAFHMSPTGVIVETEDRKHFLARMRVN